MPLVSNESTNPSISLFFDELTLNDEHWRVLVRSGISSFCNILITFPINKIIFRQQAEGLDLKLTLKNINNEGINKLYRGIIPPLLQKSVSVSLMFGVYESVYNRLIKRDVPKGWATINAALTAGTVEAFLSPFERVQVLLQSRTFNPVFKSTREAIFMLPYFGLKEYYRGFSAVLLRNGPSNVCFFSLREILQSTESKIKVHSHSTDIAFNFINGALLGAFISTVFLPLNTVRVSMQDRLGGKFISIPKAALELINKRGWKSLYRGVYINAFRSCISWGIINSCYEHVKKFI